MDTRSRKWTNKVLITLVMIAMTLSGIYGLDTINNMAVTGDNSFSLDEQDQSDYIKNTQMSLFDKWADQEGDKVDRSNHAYQQYLLYQRIRIFHQHDTVGDCTGAAKHRDG